MEPVFAPVLQHIVELRSSHQNIAEAGPALDAQVLGDSGPTEVAVDEDHSHPRLGEDDRQVRRCDRLSLLHARRGDREDSIPLPDHEEIQTGAKRPERLGRRTVRMTARDERVAVDRRVVRDPADDRNRGDLFDVANGVDPGVEHSGEDGKTETGEQADEQSQRQKEFGARTHRVLVGQRLLSGGEADRTLAVRPSRFQSILHCLLETLPDRLGDR